MNVFTSLAHGTVGSSILLIDLENFYLAREQNTGAYAAAELSNDIELMAKFVDEVSDARRVTVRRAYANYNTARQSPELGRWDFYLQKAPKALMERGIEPVQVFRFPGGGNKNAADMRMAMDASVLVSENHRIEQCVLVTGDADFIPLILDLKRRGIEVVVIGVRGHTKTVLQRYCDRFEYFEELIAATEIEGDGAHDLEEVKLALHGLLARREALVFAAVKPMLSKQLGRPFDPTRYDCENTGAFLRAFAERLEVTLSEGANDWEVRMGAPPTPGEARTDFGAGVLVPTPPPNAAVAAIGATEHTAALYHKLLRYRRPNLHVLPRAEWELVTEAVWTLSVDSAGLPREIEHQKLLDAAADLGERAGLEMAYHKVNGALFQLFKAGCYTCVAPGPEYGLTDFHWTLPAKMSPSIDSLATLRRHVREFVARQLKSRLEAVGISSEVDAQLLADVLDGPAAATEHVAELRALLR